ncbi:hypothetical protein [Vibrio rotiferianus]|uniref:hypothetical protein n=1 Tax=Vibrio rotiferianus TaxID=190895 RepID=UPI0028943C6D|nr:hypothetical protein THOE12_130086 [Vibrio rotiferianus]
MEIFKQKPYLAALLIGLVFARFVGMPMIDWQNDKRASLLLESKRVERAERAIQNQDRIEPLLKGLELKVEKNRQRLFPAQNENTFKLEQQKKMESLITALDLKVTGIGWLATKKLDQYNMDLYQLQVRFSGDGIHFPLLMAELEQQKQWLEIADFVYAFRRQSATRLGESNGQVTVNYYMMREK